MDTSANNNQNAPVVPPSPVSKLKKVFGNVLSYIKTHKKIFYIASIVLILIASCVVAFCIYRRKTDNNYKTLTYNKNTPASTSKPTPIPLIPDSGTKGTYKVSQGKHSGPTITQIILDPLDVQKNQTMEIQVKIKSDVPAEKLIGRLQTDNSQIDLSFEKVSEDEQSEIWQTSFELTDTVLYKYILTLSAIDGLDISKVTVAPRS